MTALTKHQIIERLYTGKNFNDCIGKMQPDHLREDLRAEVILVVCEWSDEKVLKLHSDGVLEFFVVRVILNTIKSNTSPFAKKYRRYHEEFTQISDRRTAIEEAVTNNHYDNSYFSRSPGSIAKVEAFEEAGTLEERQLREDLEDATLADINNLYWYDAELIRLYMKHGNFRAIEKVTGIPYTSCFNSIKKSLSLLKRRAKGEVSGQPATLFTKEEMKAIQSGSLKITNQNSKL